MKLLFLVYQQKLMYKSYEPAFFNSLSILQELNKINKMVICYMLIKNHQ